jgi:hypothetical protein
VSVETLENSSWGPLSARSDSDTIPTIRLSRLSTGIWWICFCSKAEINQFLDDFLRGPASQARW